MEISANRTDPYRPIEDASLLSEFIPTIETCAAVACGIVGAVLLEASNHPISPSFGVKFAAGFLYGMSLYLGERVVQQAAAADVPNLPSLEFFANHSVEYTISLASKRPNRLFP